MFCHDFPCLAPAPPRDHAPGDEVIPEVLNEDFVPEKRRRMHPDDSMKHQMIFCTVQT